MLRDDEEEPVEAPEPTGSGRPAWVWVTVGACVLVPLIGLGAWALKSASKTHGANTDPLAQAADSVTPPELTRSPGETKIVKYKESCPSGDISVRVDYVEENEVLEFRDAGGIVRHDALAVFVRLVNRNPGRLITLHSQVGRAQASDDVGNVYTTIDVLGSVDPDSTRDPLLRKDRTRDLRSDVPGGDVILFNRPVASASKLTVYLDAAAYGGTGTLSVTVTRADWTRKPKRQ
jgi:hypothetical protein